jgi:hypothetical protein
MFLDLVRKAKKSIAAPQTTKEKKRKTPGKKKHAKTQDSRKTPQTPANPEISLF